MNSVNNWMHEKSITYSCVISKSNYNWNCKTSEIILDGKLKNSFFLTMSCTSNGSSTYDYQFNLNLQFIDIHHDYLNLQVNAVINFGTSINGHNVLLYQDESNKKLYKANQCQIHEPSLYNTSSCSFKIKLIFPNNKIDLPIVNDLKKLLENEEYTDLKLKTEDYTFNVHKAILSARSNVFAKMIQADMLEKKTSEIKLQGADPIVVKELLYYIYTGNCKESKVPHELFKLSHYLEIESLCTKCKDYLLGNLNVKNIIDTLILINNEQYGLSDLKTLAMDFVMKNEATLIKDLDFQQYLISTICINNLTLILRLAMVYEIKEAIDRAKEFIFKNYKEVLKSSECRSFLLTHGDLMLELLEHSYEKKSYE